MRIFLFIVSVLFVNSLAAAGAQGGKVLNLQVRASDGLIAFDLEGIHDQRPACATHSYWIIKDENSATGKRQLALLIAAQASGRPVFINGSNSCTRWVDGEDVDSLTIP
jgi:hypothetical protein